MESAIEPQDSEIEEKYGVDDITSIGDEMKS
jgi:hypothetical protein